MSLRFVAQAPALGSVTSPLHEAVVGEALRRTEVSRVSALVRRGYAEGVEAVDERVLSQHARGCWPLPFHSARG